MSDRELCYSTSKAIGDEEDTLKSFMAFNITPPNLFLEWLQGVKLWSSQESLPHDDTLVTWTYDRGSNTICRTVSYAIPP